MGGSTATQDSGTAYGREPQTHDPEITEVGPGTPCGELMRRYWHPVELSGRLGRRPREIRVLGEDLVLFRDLRGRPGLITPRCIHRGAPMSFAKVEEAGIRCPYHGWLFDTEGRCLDQPCEADRPAFRARCPAGSEPAISTATGRPPQVSAPPGSCCRPTSATPPSTAEGGRGGRRVSLRAVWPDPARSSNRRSHRNA